MTVKPDEIIRSLMECDLTPNDATVYLWLVKHAKSNPSRISAGTGIKRPRVYDSLKRLMERGFVLQEVRTKRPQYVALDSEILIRDLQEQIDSKMEARSVIQDQVADQFPTAREKGIFFFNSEKALRLKIRNALEGSKKAIAIMAVFPFPIEGESFICSELLGKKSLEGQNITLLLNLSAKNWEACLNLFKKKVLIYHYPHLEQISTMIHVIDNETLFITALKRHKRRIKLEYGIYFGGEQNLIMAFNFLIQGFMEQAISLPERFKELEKSVIFPTETLKGIFGVNE